MILTETRLKLETSADIKPTAFRIKASRKAFEILSAGLYSDKVTAIIRELSTNAADAHTAAGKPDVPFKVHLPNNLEPWFAVVDYGTGLSEERVLNVYTTYFESDKTDSNEYTGALGLGSKSPFSYTDSFTVESRYNGEKSVYNAYLDQSGMPSISKMTSSPTDEGDGLTVKFPVNTNDFYQFRDKASATLRWFRVLPVIGGNQIDLQKPDYIHQNDWYAFAKERVGYSNVVMGNIAYRVNSHDFLSGYDDGVMNLRHLIEWGVDLQVKIGEVDMAASREKLTYDKRTIEFLKGKFKDALENVRKELAKDVTSQPTIWKARVKLRQVRESFKGFDIVGEWGGEKIVDHVKIGTKEVEVNDGVTVTKRHVPVAHGERLRIKSRGALRMSVKKDRVETIYADDKKVFIADDRGAYSAVRRWMETQREDVEVILLTEADADWLKETGLDEIVVKTSSLPKAVRAAYGSKGTSTKAKVYEYCPSGNSGNGGSKASEYWTPVDVDMEDVDGVYVEILYFSFRMKEGEATRFPYELKTPLELLGKLGKTPKIYGIRPSDVEDATEAEWVSLTEYIKDALAEVEADMGGDYKLMREYREIHNSYYLGINPSLFAGQKFNADSVFGKFIIADLEAERASERDGMKEYVKLRSWSGIVDGEEYKRLVDAKDEVYEKYPLLSHLSRYDSDYAVAVTEYVNLMDDKFRLVP